MPLEEKEFNEINWAALSEDDYKDKYLQCSIKQRFAAAARRKGTTQGFTVEKSADTPDFNEGDVSFIAGMPADDIFKETKAGPRLDLPKYSPEDWVLYFWQEAKESWGGAAPEFKSRVRAFFNLGFDKPADFKAKNRIVCKGELLKHLTNDQLRDGMDAMLHIGFDAHDYTSTDATDNMRRYRLRDDKKYEFLIFWRSEGFRDLDYLRKHGYQKQCNDTSPPLDSRKKARCEEINCTEEWHAFKIEANRRRLWYRKGHTDNCWYTVVSVAESWKTAVCYPKFGQTPSMCIGPDVKLIGRDAAQKKYPQYIGEVKFKSGGTQRMMVTMSNACLVLVDSEVFDTRQKQSASTKGYDEKGVSCIAGKNVIGMIKFLRVHHGYSDEEGFTAMPIRAESRLEQANGLVEAFGDLGAATDFNTRVLISFNEAISTKPVSLRWDETGWAEVPKLKYLGVYEPIAQVKLGSKTYTF